MDGQGTPGDKEQTWDTITKAAPSRVFFGWKDFYVKDHPMLTPRQTISQDPAAFHDLLSVASEDPANF